MAKEEEEEEGKCSIGISFNGIDNFSLLLSTSYCSQ